MPPGRRTLPAVLVRAGRNLKPAPPSESPVKVRLASHGAGEACAPSRAGVPPFRRAAAILPGTPDRRRRPCQCDTPRR